MQDLTMQQIKQHIEQSEYTRKNLVNEHDSITSSINSFNKANEISSSPLFLTKLTKLAKEQKELVSEIATFDEAIETLKTNYVTLQQEAVKATRFYTEQKLQPSTNKWV